MATPQDNGGPAFPTTQKNFAPEEVDFGSPGMSLRDWFAGMALQGTIQPHGAGEGGYRRVLAANCYATADAMLAARKEDV